MPDGDYLIIATWKKDALGGIWLTVKQTPRGLWDVLPGKPTLSSCDVPGLGKGILFREYVFGLPKKRITLTFYFQESR